MVDKIPSPRRALRRRAGWSLMQVSREGGWAPSTVRLFEVAPTEVDEKPRAELETLYAKFATFAAALAESAMPVGSGLKAAGGRRP